MLILRTPVFCFPVVFLCGIHYILLLLLLLIALLLVQLEVILERKLGLMNILFTVRLTLFFLDLVGRFFHEIIFFFVEHFRLINRLLHTDSSLYVNFKAIWYLTRLSDFSILIFALCSLHLYKPHIGSCGFD